MPKFGIDVYSESGSIDWKKAKSAGVDFAMIKASQGRSIYNANTRNFRDSRFVTNIVSANLQGIRCGAYHYLTAKNVYEAKEEADFFLSVLAPYKKQIKLYAAVDVEEDRYLPIKNKALLTNIVNTFCEEVKKAGYEPCIYTNPDYLVYKLGDVSKWKLWLAKWGKKTVLPSRDQYPNMVLWQYGLEKVNGVPSLPDGKTDCNYEIEQKKTVVSTVKKAYKVGDKYTVKSTDKYSNGASVPYSVIGKTYTVQQVKPDRILLKEIVSWVMT